MSESGLPGWRSFAQVRDAHREYCNDIRQAWVPFVSRATVTITALSDEDVFSGHVHAAPSYVFGNGQDEILFPLSENGMEQAEFDPILDPDFAAQFEQLENKYNWAGWKIAVIEECCHEFQYKVLLNTPDDMGNILFNHYGPLSPNPVQHPPAFSSAVAKYALAFGLDLHKLIRTLFNKAHPPLPDMVWQQYDAGHQIGDDDIRPLAYGVFDQRNQRVGHVEHGHDVEDWLLAKKKVICERRVTIAYP